MGVIKELENKSGKNDKECKDEEWKYCRVEKRGCKGCYYDKTKEG